MDENTYFFKPEMDVRNLELLIGKRVIISTDDGDFEGDIDNMNLVSKKISLRNGKRLVESLALNS